MTALPLPFNLDRRLARVCLFLVLTMHPLLTCLAAEERQDEEEQEEALQRAVVEFENPERFVDFRNLERGRDQGRPAMMADLRLYLNRSAEQFLSEGQRLYLTFTNIDLAGRMLPVRGSGQFRRYVEDFYPPRLWFHYKVVDAEGNELKSGEEKLVDFSFLRFASRSFARRSDSLPYEKALLDEWWREEFVFSIEDAINQ